MCISELACDRTLLLEVDNTHRPDHSVPPPPPPIGFTIQYKHWLCECLFSESRDCKTCEVDCEADCNDLVGESGKCFSDLACNDTYDNQDVLGLF